MRDADIADLFPSDIKPYQVQWEQATKLWREILDHPRIYVSKDSDCRARASKINYTIAERQLRDGKQRVDFKVPWEEMLVLLPEDFLKRLHGGGAYEEPSPGPEEAVSGGFADVDANGGAANGTHSSRTGAIPELARDDMKPTPRKGIYRCELKPNYVMYEGKERRIGGLRDCGRTIRGVRVPMWQVLVQITDDDAEFCVWHIVASSKLGPRVAERYLEKGEKRVVGNMRGTARDIGDISTFNWGGIAFIPHETDYRRPVTFIFGSFGEVNEFDESATFWDRSLLGKHFNQAFVDGRIDLLLGKTNAGPYPTPRKARNQNVNKPAGRDKSNDTDSESEEGSNFEGTNRGKSTKDALHQPSASEDDGDSTEAEYQEFLKFKARRRKAAKK
ncbi:hypothetical protein CBER1_11946 [Cercospora berteroae]|uniref:Uncharacterized protein n=1 Tax=Cercospora berteroae TaxID=357750 RepID=A0A2S6CNT9_9PEZI|nr:hypothetical protein CBER1_11946 [Cercospora berteroae]